MNVDVSQIKPNLPDVDPSAQIRSVTITGLAQGERLTCVDSAADSRYILAATNKVRIIH